MRPALGALVGLWFTVSLSPLAGWAASPTQTAGGTGGTPYVRDCGNGEVMVGLSGKAGQWIDGMAPWCVPVGPNGGWQSAPHPLASIGGNGNPAWPPTSFQAICPTSHAVSGFSGREGQYLDFLTIECRALGSNGRLTGPTSPLPGAGGARGTAFGSIRCTGDQPATGIHGKSGTYVDSLGLKCTPESIWRPLFHFSPQRGWMNDPAGLVFLNGQYHLHYQAIPGQVTFDPARMTWGHAVSTNLVDWASRPTALSVVSSPLPHAPYTGSAVALTGPAASAPPCSCPTAQCILAIFTRHLMPLGNQYQAVSPSCDSGETHPLQREQKVLERFPSLNFRDPKVIRYQSASGQGHWVMVLAVDTRVELFKSTDLLSWTPLSVVQIYPQFPPQLTGPFVETPDLVPLQVEGSNEWKWVLLFAEGYLPPLVCEMVSRNMPPTMPGGTALREQLQAACDHPAILGNYSKSFYLVGEFDGTSFVPDSPGPQPGGPWRGFARLLDAGPDFYAPQTWVVPATARIPTPATAIGVGSKGVAEPVLPRLGSADGGVSKYILAGWQSNWRYAHALPTQNWRGHLAIPRELSLVKQGTGHILIQEPVAQLEAKRSPSIQSHVRNLPIRQGLNNPVPAWRSTHYEAVMTVDVGSSSKISIHVRARDSEQGATIGWQRSASGLVPVGALQERTVAKPAGGRLFLKRSVQSFDAGAGEPAPAGYNGEWPVAFDGRTTASLPLTNGKHTLRLFVDQSSVEAFAGGGRVVLSAVMFPDSDNLEFQIASDSDTATLDALDLYELTGVRIH